MENLYTISEVADKLHKSEISISRYMKDGKLAFIEVSERRRLVSESQLGWSSRVFWAKAQRYRSVNVFWGLYCSH